MSSNEKAGHGWWPYLLPYLSFLLMGEIGSRLEVWSPDAWLPLLALKPAVPFALILYFGSRGAYPELRGFAPLLRGLPLDVAFGALTALLWMAPYVALPALRPGLDGAFDPSRAGAELAALALALRFIGYALVTPVFEELFIRSFVMRYAEVFDQRRHFRDVPIAHFTQRSFWISSILFTMGHAPWEYWVCVPWVMLTSAYFYWRGHVAAVIVVHAVANATILVAALTASGCFPDGAGGMLSLWFFV